MKSRLRKLGMAFLALLAGWLPIAEPVLPVLLLALLPATWRAS